jgi:hypothetical protein
MRKSILYIGVLLLASFLLQGYAQNGRKLRKSWKS